MVECTGLENQQSRKVLVGSNPTASASYRSALALAILALAACSTVPGETTASREMQRAVSDRVLTLARQADPQCKQQKVATTEMTEVHADGRSAQETWTVESCGRRMNFIVTFPPKRPSGTSVGFSVRPER